MMALLRAGADINSSDRRGRTPLHNVLSPLSYTAAESRTPATRFLLEHQAKVNAVDDDGITPLMLAAGATEIEHRRFFLNSEKLYDLLVQFGGNSEPVAKNSMSANDYTNQLVAVLNVDEPSIPVAGFHKPEPVDKPPLSLHFSTPANASKPADQKYLLTTVNVNAEPDDVASSPPAAVSSPSAKRSPVFKNMCALISYIKMRIYPLPKKEGIKSLFNYSYFLRQDGSILG